MMKKVIVLLMLFCVASVSQAELISYYDMSQTAGPLVDVVDGQTAEEVGVGHIYTGTTVGLSDNGAWQLDLAESAKLNSLTNNFTVAAWVYLDSSIVKSGTNAHISRIIGDDNPWDADTWSLGVRNTDGALLFTKNGVVDAYASSATLASDRWVHLAAVVSSTAGIEFYVDGVLEETFANTADCFIANTHPTWFTGDEQEDVFSIGRSYGGDEAQWWNGSLDEVRVYDTVLDADAIAVLAIPEPATMLLLGMGGILLRKRR